MTKENKKVYDVNYFIKKFENTAEWQWICGSLTKENNGKIMSCALGLCGVKTTEAEYKEKPEAEALVNLFFHNLKHDNIEEENAAKHDFVTEINDYGKLVPNADKVKHAKLAEILLSVPRDEPREKILQTLYYIKELKKEEEIE